MLTFFFFNDTATTEISPLPLHAALPISRRPQQADDQHFRLPRHTGNRVLEGFRRAEEERAVDLEHLEDRKSTRLNSSHANISYAVFCLKKKKKKKTHTYYILHHYNILLC